MNRKKLFAIGFFLMALPLLLQMWDGGRQKNIVATYWEEMEAHDESELEECIEQAREYNEKLYQSSKLIANGEVSKNAGDYEKQLSLSEDGIMGTLEIPQISLQLPIYHGTSEQVLSKGIGHLKESSLPIGGENAHSVLTGHRGLPEAQLFTRLDEVEKEDVFFVRVCGEVLPYRVTKIQIVKPEEVDTIKIQPQKDQISLVTCTPYGLNTHRLVVTGERTDGVEISEAKEQKAEGSLISKRDLFLILVLVIFSVLAWLRWSPKTKKRQRRIGLTAMLAILVFGFPIRSEAASGSVEIVLPNSSQEQVLFSKVADMEGERFILCEEYKNSGLDLNELETARELEEAAQKLEKRLQNSTVISVEGKKQVEINGLEKGAYLFVIKGDKKWSPVLVSVPTWMESEKEMSYQITVIPKYTENPKTGWEDEVLYYLALLLCSFLVVRKIIAHKN